MMFSVNCTFLEALSNFVICVFRKRVFAREQVREKGSKYKRNQFYESIELACACDVTHERHELQMMFMHERGTCVAQILMFFFKYFVAFQLLRIFHERYHTWEIAIVVSDVGNV